MVFRYIYYGCVALVAALNLFFYLCWPDALYNLFITGPLVALGCYDVLQTKNNILRNYPVWGHWRYLLLKIRPQIQQYFINTNQSGRPFNKEMRDLVNDRANNSEGLIPFGTQLDVDKIGFEWIAHSHHPKKAQTLSTRHTIGNHQCKQPYSASRLNISAMSFGAISAEAIRALNRGAKQGGFAQDTGEGGLSKHHLKEGGDLIFEIGTGYFGIRDKQGLFDPEQFKHLAALDAVKMIEIKLSQGAKPAHGAILPAHKVTAEIAEARGIPANQDCDSPSHHASFSTPLELMHFIVTLRKLSSGKPIGIKLCIGKQQEFMNICKAMIECDIFPDFMVIDGSEGGTGAAPQEFTDHIGMPLNDALNFVSNCLIGLEIKSKIKIIASGKIITGFDMIIKMSLGADACNMARGMMFALGCIQSRRCHLNTCPTGIATQDKRRRYALNIDYRAPRVDYFHKNTIDNYLQVLGAMGCEKPEDISRNDIFRRVSQNIVLDYADLYTQIEPGIIQRNNASGYYRALWQSARPDVF